MDLQRTQNEIERTTSLGWQTGVQLFASLEGEVVVDLATGEARPNVPMKPSTIVEWGSATKPVTCCALVLLWQRGLLSLDDFVCAHIPEFAVNGKEVVTIRHLLTHSGGLSDVVHDVMPWAHAIARICQAPLMAGWIPGQRCAYNSVGMWILAEIVVRLSGMLFAKFIRKEIFGPLGLHDSWIGMPDETFRKYGNQIAIIPGFERSGTREWVTWGRPTGGGHGPIRELGQFYAALLRHELLSEPAIEAMTARHQYQVFDELLEATVDRGLGFMLDSSYPGHTYGPHASRYTYGHGGRNWCVAFADPVHNLAVSVYWNGRVDGETHAERQPKLLAALYENLGLAD